MNLKKKKIYPYILFDTILIVVISLTILSFKTQKQDVFTK